ncbi:hypothetical protein ACS49_02865 [Bacillus cereus]|nr:hypothetical protein ACS49_02865 [Bacillus cereus]
MECNCNQPNFIEQTKKLLVECVDICRSQALADPLNVPGTPIRNFLESRLQVVGLRQVGQKLGREGDGPKKRCADKREESQGSFVAFSFDGNSFCDVETVCCEG